MKPTLDYLIESYIHLREQETKITKRHKAALAEAVDPIKAAMVKIEGALNKIMSDMGATSVRSAEGKGLAFFERVYSVKTTSREDLLAFVQERERTLGTAAWDLLDIKANKTAVRAYIEEQAGTEAPADAGPAIPPGLHVEVTKVVRVHNK